jgi:F-type H+-transporting ATPase subunit a
VFVKQSRFNSDVRNITILFNSTALIVAVLLFISMKSFAQDHGAAKPQDASTVHAQADTARHTAAEPHGEAEEDVSKFTPQHEMLRILDHKIENTTYIHEYPFPKLALPTNWVITLGSFKINMSPSRHVVYLWLSALLTVLFTVLAVRQNRRNTVPRGFGNMMESVVAYVRDEIAVPFLGKNAQKYLPLLLTFFFFIATMNLLGLLPFGATATGNINVTAGLAMITLSFMLFGGMRANGALGYWKGLMPHGIPWWLVPLIFLIEIISIFTKPFALTIRLFANMLSGGLVIGTFYALIFGMDTVAVAPLSLAFLLFMQLLKIFVCLLQAYIFTMLSSFFIGMSVHQEH